MTGPDYVRLGVDKIRILFLIILLITSLLKYKQHYNANIRPNRIAEVYR
jgi:hypothetical protein